MTDEQTPSKTVVKESTDDAKTPQATVTVSEPPLESQVVTPTTPTTSTAPNPTQSVSNDLPAQTDDKSKFGEMVPDAPPCPIDHALDVREETRCWACCSYHRAVAVDPPPLDDWTYIEGVRPGELNSQTNNYGFYMIMGSWAICLAALTGLFGSSLFAWMVGVASFIILPITICALYPWMWRAYGYPSEPVVVQRKAFADYLVHCKGKINSHGNHDDHVSFHHAYGVVSGNHTILQFTSDTDCSDEVIFTRKIFNAGCK